MKGHSEVKRRMTTSVLNAFVNCKEWGTDQRGELEILNPISNVKQAIYMVHRIFTYMAQDIRSGLIDDEVYYVKISEPMCIHPAYVVGTLMALLMAEPKKIFLDCVYSYEDKKSLLDGTEYESIIREIIKDFPEIELVNLGKYDDQKWFDYINEHIEITHLVRLGNLTGLEWELRFLRDDLTIHLPSASFAWIDYSSKEAMEKDEDFQKFQRLFTEGVYDCEAACDENMEALKETEVPFEAVDWIEFVEYYAERMIEDERIIDRLPVFIFSDKEVQLFQKEIIAPTMIPITKASFDFDTLFYKFTDLLKKKREV